MQREVVADLFDGVLRMVEIGRGDGVVVGMWKMSQPLRYAGGSP